MTTPIMAEKMLMISSGDSLSLLRKKFTTAADIG
jgi:hypothetical protein